MKVQTPLIRNLKPIFFKNEILEFEQNLISKGKALEFLIEKASQAVSLEIKRLFGPVGRVLVLVGPGNNGKDAFYAGRILQNLGYTLGFLFLNDRVYSGFKNKLNLKPKLLLTLEEEELGLIKERIGIFRPDVLIDGFFGLNFRPPLPEKVAALFSYLNELNAFRVAVDLPSGVEADTAKADEFSFKADVTVTFFALKPAHVLSPAVRYAGRIVLRELGFKQVIEEFKREKELFKADLQKKPFSPYRRKTDDHKKIYPLLVIAGSKDMPGAAYLASLSAYFSGASYVAVASERDALKVLKPLLPEAVFYEIDFLNPEKSLALIDGIIKNFKAVVIGPGLSRLKPNLDFALKAIELISKAGVKAVIDGDALHALSLSNKTMDLSNAVLTPHKGEAERFFKDEKDPISMAFEISKRFSSVCALKMSSVIVASKNQAIVFNQGKPNLATAGSGDVLSGIIGAFLTYEPDPYFAALNGVAAHCHASTYLYRVKSSAPVLASEIASSVRIILEKMCGDTDVG